MAVRAAIVWMVNSLTGLFWTMNPPRKGHMCKTQKMIPNKRDQKGEHRFFDSTGECSGLVVECLTGD